MLLYILYQKKKPIEPSIKACNEWGSAAGKTIADVLDEQWDIDKLNNAVPLLWASWFSL